MSSESTPTGALSTGTTVGRYRLLGPLGEGGMGVVYRAEDTTLGRHAALKFLPVHLAQSEDAAARLLAEARAASSLDHRHICTIYEVGEAEDGRFFIAMACYDGQSLADRLKEGPVPVEEAVRIATEMACALEAAHAEGIVHRDIKPSNIFLTSKGTVKLLDFGVAKVQGAALTKTGDTLGTIQYMAPEQTRGVADTRGDLWALGAVLYEMIVGERLFSASYDGALLFDILYMDVDLGPVRAAGAPDAVTSIIARCLQRDPEERMPSAEALREALEGAFRPGAPTDIPAVPPASTAPSPVDPPTVAPMPTAAAPTTPPDALPTAADPTEVTTVAAPFASPLVAEAAARPALPRAALAAAAVVVVGAIGAFALSAGGDGAEAPRQPETALASTAAGGAAGDPIDSVADGAPAGAATDVPAEAQLPAPTPQVQAPAPQAQAPPQVVYRDRPVPARQAAPPPVRQAAPPPQPATLVSRAPAGVTVSVNGQAVGGSTSVPAGTHTVVFRHPQHGQTQQSIRVSPGETKTLSMYFTSEVRIGAQLAEGSGPAPFAAVWVDGRNTGAFTPTSVTLGPGRHTIELRRDGWSVLNSPQTVVVEPSPSPMTQSLSFRLASNAP